MGYLKTGALFVAENMVCVVMHRSELPEECLKCVYLQYKNRRDVITHAEHSQKWFGGINTRSSCSLASISHLHICLKHYYMLFYIIIISSWHFTLITTREVELFNATVILLEYTERKRSCLCLW